MSIIYFTLTQSFINKIGTFAIEIEIAIKIEIVFEIEIQLKLKLKLLPDSTE